MEHNPDGVGDGLKEVRSQCRALKATMDALLGRDGRMSVPEIVGVYYQVMSLRSAADVLLLRYGEDATGGAVGEARRLIEREFDQTLHPRAASELSETIQEYVRKLRTDEHYKSEDGVKGERDAYARLREAMSTREFVLQYGTGLANA